MWNQLVGTEVYDSGEKVREGAHVYVHSRKDGKPGYTYVIINNSKTDGTTAELPADGELYLLDAQKLRSQELRVNGEVLKPIEGGNLPAISPRLASKGTIEIPPASVAFLIV